MKIIATILTALVVVSCESVTPEQVERAHDLYHILTGEPCLIAQPLYCK